MSFVTPRWLLGLFLLGFLNLAQAQVVDFELYVDSDYNAGTGCTVNLPNLGETFGGVEVRIRTTVNNTGTTITAVGLSNCTGPGFGAETPLAAGIPVGQNVGISGADVVEFVATQASIAPAGGTVRLYLVGRTASGEDALLTDNGAPGGGEILIVIPGGGGPVAVPVPVDGLWAVALLAVLLAGIGFWLLKRNPHYARVASVLFVLALAGLVWAGTRAADGDVSDWLGDSALALDPLNDASSGEDNIDIVALFVALDSGQVWFRVDVADLGPPGGIAPVAADDNYGGAQDTPLTIPAPGVLSNDSDANGDALTVVLISSPSNGTLGLNADGSFTYTPNAGFVGNDTFSYQANDGALNSNTATVTITITAGANPVANDDVASVAEDSGANAIAVLANDTDAEADPFTIASVVQPANGIVVITGGGTGVSYQPNGDYCNTPPGTTLDTFSYALTPGGDTATVTVTVTCVDDAPVAVNDTFPVSENAAATALAVLANDTDVDGGPISIASVTQPANGTVVITGGGTGLTYEPDPNYCDDSNPDTFNYTLAPGGSSTMVTVIVSCSDTPPVAVDDAAAVNENAAATPIAVLANDTDVDAGPIQINGVTQPANGVVVITGGGTGLTYQPNANYCNTPPGTTLDTFTYTLAPGGSIATVSVTVNCVDEPPVAVDDAIPVSENAAATPLAVLANDTDPDGGPISIASVTQPANGTVVITGGGSGLTYQPDLNYCDDVTPDTFTYTLAPGGSTATVSVSVACSDDPPVAVDDAATVDEDAAATAITVLANDTDVDGGPILINGVTQPANGVVVITGGGTGLTYQPNADYCNAPPGTTLDTFTYTLAPGGSIATVTVTVTCIDDLPVAVDDAFPVAENAPATALAVLANDTDADGGAISITSVTQPANGAVVITGGGTGLTYQPNLNFCNDVTPDTFTYTLTPGGSTATVSVSVACVDDPPVAVDDAGAVLEDAGATAVAVLANDTDVDAGPIAITSVTQPANGAVVITGGGTGLTYQPNANYCNTPPGTTLDTFTYTLAPGGSTATVSMTVDCVDDLPFAADDAAAVTEDDPATTIDVLANDSDVELDAFLIGGVTQPANGAVVITNGGLDLTYQPNPDYCNTPPGTLLDTFTYTLAPGGAVGTVSVTVNCVDDLPVAVDDAAAIAEDSPATAIDVLANDFDVDLDPFTVTSVTQPANGTVVITGGGTGLTYQPNAAFCDDITPDTFTYTLAPGGSTATVSVAVACDDDPPTAVDDAATLTEDDPATAIDVLANDTDTDGGPILVNSVTQPANGTVVITGGGTGLTYQPNPDYCNDPPGTTLDTFTYTLAPGGSIATVAVTVTCVDDGPVAVDDAATVNEDSAANPINVLANDTDTDGGAISITSVTQPANGTVVITGGGTGLTYQPNPNYCNAPPGTTLDTFTYTLTPGGSTATVTVTVTCVDDNPVAVDDAANVVEDSGANAIDVLANDTDVDGGPISITAVTQPANGTVVITGGGTGLTFQPNANFCSPPNQVFTYTLTPGGSVGTVTVTVNCVDDPPVAVADAATVDEDSGANAINVLANDTDVDGGPISVTSVTQPTNGTVVITGGGTGLTYAPNANYCNAPPGTTLDTFTYTLTPGGSSTTVTMTVNCINDPPTVTAPAGPFNVVGNVRIQVPDGASDLLSAAADVDGPAPITVQFASYVTTQGGDVTVNQTTGAWTYNPPAGYTGADSFNYAVCDAAPLCSAAVTVNLTVSGMIWFVDNTAGACVTGCGRLTSPFNTLAAFQAVNNGAGNNPAGGDSIFLYQSATDYVGPVTLLTGQNLIGQDATAALAAIAVVTPGPFSDPLPAMNSADGVFSRITSAADAIVLSNGANAQVRGLRVGNVGAGNSGVLSGATFGTLTLNDFRFNGTGRALGLTSGTLVTDTLAELVSSGSTTQGLFLNTVQGNLTVTTTTITNPTGDAVAILNSSVTVNLGATTINKPAAGSGVVLNGNTGATTFNTLAVTTGAGTALRGVNNSGAINVVTAAGSTVSATGGAAIDIANAAGNPPINLNFTSVTGTNSAPNGVRLIRIGGTGLSVSGATSLGMAAGTNNVVDIVNSTATTLAISPASTVTITSRRASGVNLDTVGGTVSFGATTIANPNAAGGYGIRVANSSAAVTFASATITAPNQTVATTDGGADGIPDNDGDGDAIFLSTTTGSFTLNGGTLSNLETDGIDCRNCRNVSINGVTINNIGTNSGNVPTWDDAGFKALNITGTNNITNSTISRFHGSGPGGAERGIDIVQTTGNNLTMFRVNNTDIFNDLAVGIRGDDGISYRSTGAVNGVMVVENGTTIQEISGLGIEIDAGASAGSSGTFQLDLFNSSLTASFPDGTLVQGGLEQQSQGGMTIDFDVQTSTFNGLSPANANAGVIHFAPQQTSGNVTYVVNGSDMLGTVPGGQTNRGAINLRTGDLPGEALQNLTLVMTDNDINDIGDDAGFFHVRGDALNGGNPGRITVANNRMGNVIPVGQDGLEAFTLRAGNAGFGGGAKTLHTLFNNNIFRNADNSAGDEPLDIDAENSARINATVTNNTFTSNGLATHEHTVHTEAAAATICLDLRNNTATGGGPGSYLADQATFGGTYFLNQSGNTGTFNQAGVIGAVASCPLP